MDKIKLKSLLVCPATTIKQAMQKLSDTQERILFVVDNGKKLLGTINDGDIRRALINGFKFDDSVGNVMHKSFVSVDRDVADIEGYSKRLMLEKKIEQIPVLDKMGIINDVILWTDIIEEGKQSEPANLSEAPVVIMAGGRGTRLDPFTKILPKPLIPIGNKPVIEIIMERFYKYGFYKFFYTLNYKKEYLKLFLMENKFPYVINIVEEDDFMGTAGGLALLKDKIKESFFVVNCDSLLDVNFEDILKWHKEHKAAMTIIGCHNEVKIPFGVLQLSDGKLAEIVEKPVHDIIINTGVYVIEPHVISYIPEGRHMDMNKLIETVIEKEKVSVYPIYKGWFDIGQWEEYKKTVENLQGAEDI